MKHDMVQHLDNATLDTATVNSGTINSATSNSETWKYFNIYSAL